MGERSVGVPPNNRLQRTAFRRPLGSTRERMVPLDINRKAPATASTEAVILAPLNVVWSILTRIDGWSRWNPNVSRVELRRPLMPGTKLHWKAGSGASIVSTLQEVESERRVAWTGRLGIRAVHVWTFEEGRWCARSVGGVFRRIHREALRGTDATGSCIFARERRAR